MSQTNQNQTASPSGGIPPIVIVIGIVAVIAGAMYFMTRTTTPASGTATKPAAKAASVDAVVDPQSPTGYVDSGGVPVNKDGSDYTGGSTYVNMAVANFGKTVGY